MSWQLHKEDLKPSLLKSHQKPFKVIVQCVCKYSESPIKLPAVDTASVEYVLNKSRTKTTHVLAAKPKSSYIIPTKDCNDPYTSLKYIVPIRVKAANGWENWDSLQTTSTVLMQAQVMTS